jgi:hypothetical protein
LPHRPHTRESCCHKSDSHKFAEGAIFRGALNILRWDIEHPYVAGSYEMFSYALSRKRAPTQGNECEQRNDQSIAEGSS